MKRFVFLALTVVVSLLSKAERVEIGQLRYDLNDDALTAEVISHMDDSGFNYPDLTGTITIPSAITIGDKEYSVTAIGNSAFYTCEGLEGAVLPPTVTRIGNYAFSQCIGMSMIVLPASVNEIGVGAFANTALREVELTGEITSIPSLAFAGTDLEIVNLPSSVVSIGSSAFADCSKLREINVGDNLTDIGDGAFERCHSLETVNFPATLLTVGQRAFKGCSSLPRADFDSVITIGQNAFEKCTSLAGIDFGSGNLTIGDYAFSECGALEDVVIPASVDEIGGCAFYDCLALKSLRIENGDKNLILGGAPFANDPVEEMFVGRNVITTNKNDNVFSSNKNLTRLILGDGMTSIPPELFSYLPALQEVTFGFNVAEVGYDAFASCPMLTTVRCKGIAEWVNIDFLDSTANPLNSGAILYVDGTPVSSLILPEGIVKIGENNFAGYSKLTDATLPSSLTSVGEQAFMDCSGLTSVTFRGSIPSVGGRAFRGCESLVEVYCPSLEAWLGNGFETALANPLSYGARLYADGKLIEDIAIPSGVAAVGNFAFVGYDLVSRAEICGDVAQVGRSAFEDCASLTEIDLGESMKALGNRAFNGTPLTAITSRNPVPPVFETATTVATFGTYDAIVYVPEGSLDAYRSDKSWRNFANIEEKDLSGIDSTTIPENETFILDGNNIRALCDIRIYDIGGLEIGHLHTGTSLSLEGGMYVVSSATAAFKVAVRQ